MISKIYNSDKILFKAKEKVMIRRMKLSKEKASNFWTRTGKIEKIVVLTIVSMMAYGIYNLIFV